MQRATAESIIAAPKLAEPAEDWREFPSGIRAMEIGVVDSDGARIQGLTVVVHVYGGRSVKRQKIVFGLFQYELGVKDRVYQLQLDEATVFTHRDARLGRLYGTHAHIGNEAEPCPEYAAQWTFAEGLDFFCRRINLTFVPPLSDPFEFRLK